MDDVGDDEVGLVDHPFVSVADREALRCGLDAFGQDGVGIVGGVELASLLQHIREHDAVSDRIHC